MKRRIWRAVRSFLAVLVVASVFILAMTMFFESSMVYPAPGPTEGNWAPTDFLFEAVDLAAEDGTRLHGWYLPHAESRVGVVYFHGNGEHVPWVAPELAEWRDELRTSILVVDYRGYGKSEGKPSEKLLVADGVLAVRWLANRQQVEPREIVLWGRSIGGGVAAGVAEVTQPHAMVMEATFDSIVEVAASHIRWLPVRWLMRNRYPSVQRLASFRGAFLQWHGDSDLVVPLANAQKLFAAIASPSKQFILGQHMGHNDESPQAFKRAVKKLFDRLNEAG